MSAAAEKKTLSLDDFADLLAGVYREGVEAVVIGGCAVGAYGRLMGETILSGDLDVLVARNALEPALEAASKSGARVLKWPQPRSVPVAVLEWQGKEVNVLASAAALAPAETEIELAREFHLKGGHGGVVLVVDPFELLRNKLACNRPKDQPHIAIMLRFLEEEVVHVWNGDEPPRRRLAPARRLLETLREARLREHLAGRLIPTARTGPELRFLMQRAPDSQVPAVVARAAAAGLAAEIASVAGARSRVAVGGRMKKRIRRPSRSRRRRPAGRTERPR